MTEQGHVAFVAGGTAGAGRAVVTALAKRGYKLGVMARGAERLRELQKAFPDQQLAVEMADVSDAEALAAAADRLVEAVGKPTVWVNCAMLTSFSPFEKIPASEFEAIVRTTLIGQVNGTREALRLMSSGHIVNLGSGLSYRSVPFQSAYCAAKHGINGFTSAVRSEMIREGRDIHLSLIQLPAMNTPQFTWARNRLSEKPQPAPPVYSPAVAAEAVLKAIDTDAREIFVGTSVIQLVFGDMLLPAWLDRKMAKVGAEMQKSGTPEPGERPDNIDGPVDHPASAAGAFSKQAYGKALIMDADLLRKLVFGGGAALIFILGLIIG